MECRFLGTTHLLIVKGNYLLVGSNDRLMKLFHAGMGDLVRTFEGHMDLVRTVAFDANVGVAVSGSYDKTIRVRWTSSITQADATDLEPTHRNPSPCIACAF